MERIKNMSLKKAFFLITAVFLVIATMLSILTVIYLTSLRIEGNEITVMLKDDGTYILTENTDQTTKWITQIINVLQIGLPVLFYVTALLLSYMVFYRLKLKKPFAILQSGTERIQRHDLDFTIEKYADDELGALCTAFETMRFELLKSNRELWRQMEERKRLNAAFSHDLRNPVTVLKGSAAILRKGLENGVLTEETAGENISLINQYAGRIENYVEAMTSAQKLEDLKFNPQSVAWSVLVKELENSLSILNAHTGKEIQFLCNDADRQIETDKYIIHNTAENLVSNALRYAKDKVIVELSCDDDKIVINVSDDGTGFSSTILNKGAVPFLRDDNTEQGAHFGMGLYICRLLCEKHGGSLILENCSDGAKATAIFNL
jgi:signal transduction histidine kinase